MITFISSRLTLHCDDLTLHRSLCGRLHTWPEEAVDPSCGRARRLPTFIWNQEFPALFSILCIKFQGETSTPIPLLPKCCPRRGCSGVQVPAALLWVGHQHTSELLHVTGRNKPTFFQFMLHYLAVLSTGSSSSVFVCVCVCVLFFFLFGLFTQPKKFCSIGFPLVRQH